ncbi:MAG: hypothetical protein J2O47_06665, partial [Acidimicrobiaceae bacterium]|nr:hypothetical protein [Acidimicrobiaceae bacterium]
AERPKGVPAVVPPPWLPLTFLAAAGLGVIACGAMLVWAAPTVVAHPMADRVIGAAQFGTLAVLSMGVLGALHQFAPVAAQRPLRSIRLAQVTFAAWLVAAWLVPVGLITRHEPIIAVGGAFVTVAVIAAVVNLGEPLRARGKGTPVVGLRLAMLGLVLTAASGATFVADRSGTWFVLSGHVVLAHAVIGLFFWLGMAYISVAEKLWPMFLLAHLPRRHHAGTVAVWATAAGVIVLSLGIWGRSPVVSWFGGTILAIGLGSHLVSLVAHVRHRRRGADLHLTYVLTAGVWLIGGAVLALIAAVVPASPLGRERLVGADVAAIAGWLLTALVGHAHKVVPFIAWTALRAAGVDTRNGDGRPLLFADLYNHTVAWITFALTELGIAAVGIGLLANLSVAVAVGGAAWVVTGLIAAANLTTRALHLRTAAHLRAGTPGQGATRPGIPAAGS